MASTHNGATGRTGSRLRCTTIIETDYYININRLEEEQDSEVANTHDGGKQATGRTRSRLRCITIYRD